MINLLRAFFVVVLVAMLGVTAWASADTALWGIPREIGAHPWFVACLFDAYFGFLTFYAWVIYKEQAWSARVGWLVSILLLGNIAMAVYMLNRLFRLPSDAPIERLLLREEAAR
jgi:hypothetical protein